MNIVIIGASFAGLACAIEARSLYPQAEIDVLEASDKIAYFPSSFQWNVKSGQEEFEASFWKDKKELEAADIQLHLQTKVLAIHPKKKSIQTERGEYSYDRLVLAMGAGSDSTYIKGTDQSGVYSLKTWKQGKAAFEALKEAGSVAIIGGGPIGIEVAEACLAQGKEVSLFEAGPYLDFKQFDADFSQTLEGTMKTQGAHLYLDSRVQAIHKEHGQLNIQLDQATLAADLVLLGVNFRPNSKILEGVLDLHMDGRVKVFDDLSTSDPHIFAAGDLAYLPCRQEEAYTPLVSTAIRSGQIVARNLFHSQQAFPPLIRLLGFHHFGLYRLSVGLLESELRLGQESLVSRYQTEDLELKLIWEKESGVILGLQVQSKSNCLALGNEMVLAIRQGLSDRDLALREFIFAPQEERLGLALHQACLEAWKGREGL